MRAKFIWQARVYERLAVRNFDHRTHAIRLTWQFQTDFADLFEVRGHRRAARGRTSAAIHAPHAIAFTYDGLAGDVSRTIVQFAPAPTRLEVGEAVFELSPAAQARVAVFRG